LRKGSFKFTPGVDKFEPWHLNAHVHWNNEMFDLQLPSPWHSSFYNLTSLATAHNVYNLTILATCMFFFWVLVHCLQSNNIEKVPTIYDTQLLHSSMDKTWYAVWKDKLDEIWYKPVAKTSYIIVSVLILSISTSYFLFYWSLFRC
jgi:hypothetical protein